MAKVKLLKPGFENYTGTIGTFAFEGGISEEMSLADAERMSASITCGIVDENGDAKAFSPLDKLGSLRKQKMKENPPSRKKEEKVEESHEVDDAPLVGFDFTEESLDEAIAKGGIKSLREIADRYDVKGTQIIEIRSTLLAKKEAYLNAVKSN